MRHSIKQAVTAMLPCWIAGWLLAVVGAQLLPLLENTVTERLQMQGGGAFAALCVFLALLFAANLFSSAGFSILSYMQERVSSRWVENRMGGIIRRLLFARPSFLAERDPVEIVARITRDADGETRFKTSCWVSVPAIALQLAMALGMMLFGSFSFWKSIGFNHQPGDWRLALLVVALSPLHLLSLAFNRRLMSENQRFAEAGEHETATLTETIRGVQDLRSSGAFPFGLARVDTAMSDARTRRLKFWKVVLVLQNFNPVIASFAHIALLGAAAWFILSRGTLSYPEYIGFAGLFGAFNAAVSRIAELVREGLEAAPARRRLLEFDSLSNVFGPEAGRTTDDAAPASLLFRGISFETPDGTEILKGVDLELRPGEHVALVGPSGSGKSTLMKAAMRHIEPSSGSVVFAGVPLSEWNHPALARRIAYVSQKPFLFDGTIRDNILMGRDCRHGDEDLLALAEEVGLLDDLRRKAETPAKALDFPVGPEGRALSGGQAAKIALARALAGDPDVLLLDEVTASLDELSQERVAHLLATKCRGKTILSVSHRFPAVRGMDRIVVMDGGRIVQEGTWDELANRPGLFADLVARVTGGSRLPPSQAEGRPSPSTELSGPSVIRALSLSPVLADLDSAQLARLAANAGSAKVAAGEFLFRRGDAGDTLCVVASGRIEINGSQYGPGYAFGEIALFGGLRRTADVLAIEDSAFVVLLRDDVLAACRETPDIALRLLGSLARIAART